MKTRIFIGAAICMVCASCTERESTSEDVPRMLAYAVELIGRSRDKVDYLKLQEEILQGFRATGNSDWKRKNARKWARMLQDVMPCLAGTDYSGYNRSVRRFNICFGCSATALEESEPDASYRLSYYAEMLRRYKSACFAIPWSCRSADESNEAFDGRKNAARVLLEEYEKTMTQWERYVMPRLLENIPADLRGEFRKTFKELMRHPSKAEFRKAFGEAGS